MPKFRIYNGIIIKFQMYLYNELPLKENYCLKIIWLKLFIIDIQVKQC